MADSTDLLQPEYILRDYETLRRDTINWLQYKSNGKLTAEGTGSVVGYLLDAQIFALRELMFLVEELPTVGILRFLSEVVGVKRSLGTKAKVSLEVTLDAVRDTTLVVPLGYEVADSQGLTFITTERLEIPPGAVTGLVDAEAENPGSQYNVPAFTINSPFIPLTGVQDIQNIDSAQGGTDEESETEAIRRGSVSIRRRATLQSKDDYVDFITETVGAGTPVAVVERYEVDGSGKPGEISIYFLNPDGTIPNSTQVRSLQQSLTVPAGIFTTVKPIPTKNIDLVLTVLTDSTTNPDTLASQLYQTFREELTPPLVTPGEDIDIINLATALKNATNVDKITSLTLNDSSINVLMPNTYTIARPSTATIYITDIEGNYFGPYFFGIELNSEQVN